MDTTSLRIIIVDDEPAHAEAIRRAFEAADIAVEIEMAGTLAAYQVAVAARPPDIALVDLNLPDGGAVEVLTAPPEAGPWPVLVITSTGNEQTAVAVMRAGALDYVVKSAEAFTAMPHTVARALREWKLLQERKRAEEALHRSEDHYRRLVESSGDMVFSLDRAGVFHSAGGARLQEFGLTSKDLVGRPLYDIFPEEEARRYQQKQLQVFEDGTAITYESTFEFAGLTETDLTTIYPIAGRQGEIELVGVVCRDITERKRAEEALREREQRLTSIYDTVGDVIFQLAVEKDGGYRFASVNLAFLATTGLTSLQVIGKRVDEVIPEPSLTLVLEKYREAIQEKRIVRWEEISEYPTGRLIGEVSVAPVFDSAGNCTHLVGAVHDITERKRAEAALEAEHLLLRTLMENVSERIYFKNVRSQFVRISQSCIAWSGLSDPAQVIGKTDFDFFTAAHASAAYEDEQAIMRSGQSLVGVEEQETRPDGRVTWASTTKMPFRDQTGRIIGTFGISRDITERKRANEALRRHAEELAALQATLLEINAPHQLPALLQTIVERAAQLLGTRGGGMYLCDPDRKEVRCVVSYNTPQDYTGTIFKYGEGAAGTVAQTGAPLMIDDYRVWGKRAAVFDGEQPFTTVLSAPMIWQGQVTGVIHVLDDVESKHFTETDLALLTLFASHAAIAVANTRLYEEAQNEITERKRAEAALHESEARLKEAQALGRIGNWEFDPANQRIKWSDETCRLYERDPAMGPPSVEEEADYYSPELVKRLREYARSAIEQARAFEYDLEARLPSGRIAYFAATMHSVRDETGRIVKLFGTVQDITERKRAEEALKEANAKLTRAQRIARVGSWNDYLPTNQLDWSEEMYRIFGFPPNTPVNLAEAIRVFPPEELERFQKAVDAAINADIPYHMDYEIIRPDGTVRCIHDEGEVVRDEQGKAIWMHGTTQDITERKQAEAALHVERALLRTLVDHLPDAIYAKDLAVRKTLANPACQHHMGVASEAEALGKTDFEVYPPDLAAAFDADDQQVLRTGQPVLNREECITLPDGSQSWQLTTKVPLRDGTGQVVGLVGIGHDITERKQAEAALRKSEERFRALIEQSHDAITLLTADGTVLYDSPSIVRVLGYSPTERIGRRVFEFVPPEEREGMAHGFAKFAQQMGAIAPSEIRFIHKDGTPRWIEGVRTNLLHEPSVRAVVVNYRDITERKQAEDRLRETLADLERSNADLQQFAYVASHDLQEPLRMVASFVQLLGERYRGQLDADADEFIGFAVDGAKRMQFLINDLLEYSRVGTHGAPFQATDVNGALDEALWNLDPAIADAGATVTHDPLPTVLADPTQLTQLLQNLIGNAIKFRGDAPPIVHVSAELRIADFGFRIEEQNSQSAVRNPQWLFAVRDNGIGIDPKDHARIFGIFQRLHSRAEYPGTGIGLAVCQRIVERHGGRIWVESQVGQGTTFYFTLPVAE